MKKLNYLLIIAGIIGVVSAILISPDVATRYLSPDQHITAQGLRSLRLYRLLALGSGLAFLALGAASTLSGQTPLQVARSLGARVYPLSLGILAAVTRFYQMDAKSLWYDELISVVVAQGSLPTVIGQVSQRPPLYDVVLHAFMRLGESDFIVRLPAAVFGIAAVVSVYYVTRELFDTETAVLAGLLLALSRFHIHYSQESRPYSLFSFLAVLSMVFFVRHLRRAGRWNLFSWFVASLSMIYTHYYGAFVLLAQGVYLLLLGLYHPGRRDPEWRPTDVVPYALGVLLMGILYLPWLPTLLRHTDAPMVWRDDVQTGSYLANTLRSYRSMMWAYSWPSSLPWNYLRLLRLAIPLLALSGLVIPLIRRQRLGELTFLSVWAGVPLISVTASGLNLGPRYFLFVLPVYLMFVSLGIVAYRRLVQSLFSNVSNERYYLVAAVVLQLLIAPSLNDYYYLHQKEDWRSVGHYLEEHARAQDSILVLGGSAGQLEHYYHGEAAVLDASDRYGGSADVRDLEGLRGLVGAQDCLWVFISGHANLLYEYWEPEKARAVQQVLQEKLIVVEGVYDETADDLRGLYRSPCCAPGDDG
ncbi:MAG: glycosyltransferase family 39 protein [Anaerolineae bacterium]